MAVERVQEGAWSLRLVTWVPTPPEIVRKMLDIAQVGSKDMVCDLGCGDARILIMAVKQFGAKKAVGYEIEEDLYRISQQEIQRQNLHNRITLIRGDLLDADLSQASIIVLYLSSEANELLRLKLEKEAKPGARIVSYLFAINGWRPARKVDLDSCFFSEGHFIGSIYLYLIPQAFQQRNSPVQ